MIPVKAVLLLTAALALAGLLAEAGRRRLSKLHRKNRRTARRLYRRLNRIASQGSPDRGYAWIQNYLRQIDPYVFEELVLAALKEKGFSVRANRKYSGDGGVDGRARKDGTRYYIQCKCYTGYASLADIRAFIDKCRKDRRKGFFVNTGLTSAKARETAEESGIVAMICDESLYNLIINEIHTTTIPGDAGQAGDRLLQAGES